MSELVIRKANPEDKDAVLAINVDFYEGADYTGAFYDEVFMECQCSTPYVAVLNGDVVGFLVAFHVDDGQTVVFRAARVKSEAAGRGIYKQLMNHARASTEAIREAFTTASSNKNFESIKKENTLVNTTAFAAYAIDSQQLPTCANKKRITLLTKDALQQFMTSELYRSYLFPDNRILVHWVPFRLLPSNIPIIWLRENDCLRISDVRSEDGQVRGLMSLSTTYIGEHGMLACATEFHGGDRSSLGDHLITHLDFIRARTNGKAILIISCKQLAPEDIENSLKEHDIPRTFKEVPYGALFEKEMINNSAHLSKRE